MGFKIMMTVIFWSCILIMYVMYFNETKPKKNIILGTTIPYSHHKDEAVLKLIADYKKWSTVVFILLSLSIVPSVFLSDVGNLFYTFTWLSFAMIIMALPYAIFNRKLRKYKVEQHLKGKTGIRTDLKLSSVDIKAKSPYYSLIPLALSLIPTIYFIIKHPTGLLDILISTLTMSGTIFLCLVLHIITNRRKKDVASDNTDINYALSVIRARNWARMFIGMNWLLCGMSFLFMASMIMDASFAPFVTIGIMLFSFGSVFFAMYIEFDTRKKQQAYAKVNLDKSEQIADEDDYWFFGMFYFNKNDNRIMIPDRVGSGTTVNMARPIGKILMAFSAICIVGLPFFGGWFYMVDKTPMTVEFTDKAIIATHTKVEYNIPMDTVTEIEKTDKCPKIVNKINGWATDNVEKGKFSVKDLGVCQVFVTKDADEFAIVKTKDGQTYILGY